VVNKKLNIKKFNCHLKDNEITTLTFWGHVTSSVTDHSTTGGRLPMGGPLWPCIYLAPLWRYYGISNFGRMHAQTHTHTILYSRRWFYTLSNTMHCIGQTMAHSAFFSCESSCCFQRILAIAILSVCHMGGSVKSGAS